MAKFHTQRNPIVGFHTQWNLIAKQHTMESHCPALHDTCIFGNDSAKNVNIKVLYFPSMRKLLRLRAKIPKYAGCDPNTYRHYLGTQTTRRDGKNAGRPKTGTCPRVDVSLAWDTMDYNV